ncbi:ABC transporter ATP-binding protein [Halobacillus shinanisalinarum]|uniref:ABC transporter ATP-binding protein n=1 Tax=Halobacillus shinanisalinarum TaxID=2932258 RepID=A0ABY4GU08_9BACI|nr:ABC transporter ATP-binding protein [Halobacillus shinanisalinarum]UOQ91633.1 ABC transporter ATP-binding protein [Halobacillus shinanisalinarum]
MIEVKNIIKSFEKEMVVNDVSFHVEKGSIYGLLGSNGAGKTTIMRLISGILKQGAGSIHVFGEEIFENVSVKNRLVFIPDSPYFFPQYTVKQLSRYYREMYSNWNEERYQKLKTVFNLDENKRLHQFSKGMQRQATFWLSLSTMPDVLILDEPFDGLDAVMRRKIKSLIIQDVAEREMTVLISSHNLREVEDICDHIGILHNGEVLLERELDDLKTDIHKIQVAFRNNDLGPLQRRLDILYQEKRGSVHLLIVRGQEDAINETVERFSPVLYDRLPLTLEEIFIYEMGGAGYAIENIIV